MLISFKGRDAVDRILNGLPEFESLFAFMCELFFKTLLLAILELEWKLMDQKVIQ